MVMRPYSSFNMLSWSQSRFSNPENKLRKRRAVNTNKDFITGDESQRDSCPEGARHTELSAYTFDRTSAESRVEMKKKTLHLHTFHWPWCVTARRHISAFCWWGVSGEFWFAPLFQHRNVRRDACAECRDARKLAWDCGKCLGQTFSVLRIENMADLFLNIRFRWRMLFAVILRIARPKSSVYSPSCCSKFLWRSFLRETSFPSFFPHEEIKDTSLGKWGTVTWNWHCDGVGCWLCTSHFIAQFTFHVICWIMPHQDTLNHVWGPTPNRPACLLFIAFYVLFNTCPLCVDSLNHVFMLLEILWQKKSVTF